MYKTLNEKPSYGVQYHEYIHFYCGPQLEQTF